MKKEMLLSKKTPDPWMVLKQSFFSMFITFSLIELSNVIASLIDGLIVSNFFDSAAMAAIGIAHPIFSISGIFGGMFVTGMQTLCTMELGRGDVKAFNRLFSAVMILGTAFSLGMMVLLLFSAEPFAILLGASGKGASLSAMTAQYLRGIGIGLPGLIMTGVLAAAINIDSGRKWVMTCALVTSGLNIVLDLAVVALHLGLFGIGLATAVSQYLHIILLSLHFFNKDRMLRFVPLHTNPKEMLHLMYCGTEKALRRFGNVLRPVLLNKLIIFYGGTFAMTAMSVGNSLSDFSQFFAVGLADAAALLVGVLFGEKNDEGIAAVGRYVHRNCAQFCGFICLLFLFFAKTVARLYISEEGELLNMTAFAVRMIGLQAPLYGLLRPRIAYLQAVNKTRNMQLLSALSTLIYVVLTAAVLGSVFGAYGILACFPVSDLLSLITVWIYYSFKTRKPFSSRDDYLALPEDFHLSPGDVILLDIRNREDISLVSEQIQLFCKGHNIDESTGYEASVCFEELADNTIRYGFPKCKKPPGINLRLVYSPDELILRLQDNCPPFNVEREIAMAISRGTMNPEENLGLKILGGLDSNIMYVHSLETNNVILRFSLAS